MTIHKAFRILFGSALIIFSMCLSGYSQDTKSKNDEISSFKTITRNKFYEFTPISFGEVKVENKLVGFNTGFNPQQPDWIKSLSFKVRNLTINKKIAFMRLMLIFPETKNREAAGAMLSFPIDFGQGSIFIPSLGKNIEIGAVNTVFQIAPNNDFVVSIDDKYQKIADFVKQSQPIETINTVKIALDLVIFDDGLSFSSGDYFMPNQDNPTKPVKIAAPELAKYRGSF